MRSIFIVGTGRSGTHLLCKTLCTFARTTDFLGGVEDPRLLSSVARSVISGNRLDEAARLTIADRSQYANDHGRIYIDQTHPFLWFAEDVITIEPECLFLFPWRPNEQILASMLLHSGVLDWYKRLRNAQIVAEYPSRFFGIQSKNDLDVLSLHELCLARIVAHKKECLRLRGLLSPERIRILNYESLIQQGAYSVLDLFNQTEREALGPCVGTIHPDVRSLHKYSEQLTTEQKELSRLHEVPLL